MRYLLILEEYQYNDCEKVDGNPLEIYLRDKTGIKRLFDVKPIQQPMLILDNGACVYITNDHIDTLIAYEREQTIKDIIKRSNQ